MKTVNYLLKTWAATAALFAVTVIVTACEKPDDEPNPDAPAFVEFSFFGQRGTSDIDAKKRTVKAVAECGTNLASLAPEFKLSPEGTTATVDGKTQEPGKTAHNFAEPVAYTLATPDGETAEWTVTISLPDICPDVPTVKKYITYNKPVTAYYIEYNEEGERGAEAYESRKYATISNSDLSTLTYIANGKWFIYVYPSSNGGYVWGIYGTDEDYWGSATNTGYENKEYPMAQFAAWISTWGGESTYFIRRTGIDYVRDNDGVLPDHTDVTTLYKRSEKLCGIANNIENDGDDCLVCDVYEDTYNGYLNTFWIEPTTGFTVKYAQTKNGQTEWSFAVSKILVGKPDWDGLHLHPLATDEVTESW